MIPAAVFSVAAVAVFPAAVAGVSAVAALPGAGKFPGVEKNFVSCVFREMQYPDISLFPRGGVCEFLKSVYFMILNIQLQKGVSWI